MPKYVKQAKRIKHKISSKAMIGDAEEDYDIKHGFPPPTAGPPVDELPPRQPSQQSQHTQVTQPTQHNSLDVKTGLSSITPSNQRAYKKNKE